MNSNFSYPVIYENTQNKLLKVIVYLDKFVGRVPFNETEAFSIIVYWRIIAQLDGFNFGKIPQNSIEDYFDYGINFDEDTRTVSFSLDLSQASFESLNHLFHVLDRKVNNVTRYRLEKYSFVLNYPFRIIKIEVKDQN